MNIYILVEGKQTERILYPEWLKYLAPHMVKVEIPFDAVENNYFLISGEGYPRMLDVKLTDSLNDIAQHQRFDYFWVVLDSDGQDIDVRVADVHQRIHASGINIGNCQVEVIVQNPCIETWGLGNGTMISRNQLHGSFSDYFYHYNVKDNDPELMKKPDSFLGTDAGYHERYLKEMLAMNQIRYTKKNPQGLKEGYYLRQVLDRVLNGDEHLKSFAAFYELSQKI